LKIVCYWFFFFLVIRVSLPHSSHLKHLRSTRAWLRWQYGNSSSATSSFSSASTSLLWCCGSIPTSARSSAELLTTQWTRIRVR
jgi:hypothetical protein